MASVVVDVPGPPPVIMYGISKVCSAVIVRKMRATIIDGFRSGRVISKNCLILPAPSTSAAS